MSAAESNNIGRFMGVKRSFTPFGYSDGMYEAGNCQNRRQRRSNVLMAAALELSGASIPVKLRNLSADGALVEGERLPVEGAEVIFRRNELAMPARVVWVREERAGISFRDELPPETVLRHVPTPRPRVMPEFRRPGFNQRPLSVGERRLASEWNCAPNHDLPGD